MRITPDGKLAVKDGDNWSVFDTSFVYEVEGRIEEVRFVTPHKAPELLAYFNRAWLRLGEIISRLEEMLAKAKTKQELAKASVLLDRCDHILKEKGLKPSVDLREAVVSQDADYQKATAEMEGLKAAVALFEIKHKGIEMAYLSVRKIVGESTYNMKNSSNHNRGSDSTPVGGVRGEYGRTSED